MAVRDGDVAFANKWASPLGCGSGETRSDSGEPSHSRVRRRRRRAWLTPAAALIGNLVTARIRDSTGDQPKPLSEAVDAKGTGSMPDERVGDPGYRGSTIADLAEAARPGSVDGRHLLLVGAGPGLGMAVARRFAVGGYQVTLMARSTDRLGDLAGTLADTGAKINTVAADASDPDGLGARMRELYLENGAPGVIVYNAVMGAPDRLLSSSVAHLQTAYSVDVISAIVVAAGGRPGHAGRRFRDHSRHRGRVRRPPDPGPCDCFPRQGGAPVGRDNARR